MGFNYFVQKIRIMDADLQNFSADFLNIVERDILNTDGEKQ
jgi:biopolymer transport protein TolQ